MSEYNRTPHESASVRDNRSPAEYSAAEEGKYYAENDTAEKNSARRKETGKKGSAAALSRLLATFAVVAVAGVTVMASGAFAEKGSAEIVDVSVTDTAVHYDVTVEEGENLTVVLYNDFTRREAALTEGENSGTFEQLKPNVSYTLAVMGPASFGSERAVAERTVKTDETEKTDEPAPLPPPAPVTVWRGITYGCTCAVDGYFHFTMDFDDPNGYFSDFSATLEDATGNVSVCVFKADLHAEQRIDVTLRAKLLGKTATFTLTYRTADPSAPEEIVVYSVEVKI